ncbi:MAG: hypothetical protein ACYS8Z_10380 [Planctomycetota bacterium]|jgi:sugar lactone lactonase YvrE
MTWLLCFVSPAVFLDRAYSQIVTPPDVSWEVYAEDVPMCQALAFDSDGRLYAAHDGDTTNRIYRIAPGGVSVEPFGPAVLDPDSLAVDPNDNVYIGTGSGRVYRVTPAGQASVFADRLLANTCSMVFDYAGIIGAPGDLFVANARATYNDIVRVDRFGVSHEFALETLLHIPFGLAFDDVDSLYAAEIGSGVYKVNAYGEVSPFVELSRPHSIVFEPDERILYVSDVVDLRIYRLGLDGRLGIYAEGLDARGLTFGPGGDLYVSDRTDGIDRILSFSGRNELRRGDIDLSGVVDMVDFAVLANAWHTAPPDMNWNPQCDMTIPRDYVVNMADLAVFAVSWLEGSSF